jgi:hypothetical protein
MTDWIEKAQPPIVIIENVYGAPWAKKGTWTPVFL